MFLCKAFNENFCKFIFFSLLLNFVYIVNKFFPHTLMNILFLIHWHRPVTCHLHRAVISLTWWMVFVLWPCSSSTQLMSNQVSSVPSNLVIRSMLEIDIIGIRAKCSEICLDILVHRRIIFNLKNVGAIIVFQPWVLSAGIPFRLHNPDNLKQYGRADHM